jgi:hypothetical protein
MDESTFRAEVRLVISDAREYFVGGDSPARSLNRAIDNAVGRDPLGGRAGDVAWWLIASCGGWSSTEPLDEALKVIDSEDDTGPLATRLRATLKQTAAGELDGDQFAARIRKPYRPRSTRATDKVPRSGIPLLDSADALRLALADRSHDLSTISAADVWAAFRAFSDEPVVAEEPAVVGREGFLFEWQSGNPGDVVGRTTRWVLTRQFGIVDQDGDYDHMQQLGCTVEFAFDPRLATFGAGDIWLSDDKTEWHASLERVPAFALPYELGRVATINIELERV